jgi:hypothetical protein
VVRTYQRSEGSEVEMLTSLTGEVTFVSPFDRLDFHPLNSAGISTSIQSHISSALALMKMATFVATLETLQNH